MIKKVTRKRRPVTPAPDTTNQEVDREAEAIARYKSKIRNPLTAIRSMCVECMGGQVGLVAHCTVPKCSLYPFRMGKNTMHGKHGKANPEAAKRLKSISQTKKRAAKK